MEEPTNGIEGVCVWNRREFARACSRDRTPSVAVSDACGKGNGGGEPLVEMTRAEKEGNCMGVEAEGMMSGKVANAAWLDEEISTAACCRSCGRRRHSHSAKMACCQ